MKVVTAREFNQDTSKVKRVATGEPVFVTDRGRPTHVLLSMEAYRRLSGGFDNILDLVGAAPGSGLLTASDSAFGLSGRR